MKVSLSLQERKTPGSGDKRNETLSAISKKKIVREGEKWNPQYTKRGVGSAPSEEIYRPTRRHSPGLSK